MDTQTSLAKQLIFSMPNNITRRMLLRLCFMVLLVCNIGAFAQALAGDTTQDKQSPGTYDLLFKVGTLSQYQPGDKLVYNQVLKNPKLQGETQKSSLRFDFVKNDEMTLSQLQEGRRKTLGTFPSTVGNPINMYFLETVINSMAQTTGGSPFYIRNRLKDALLQDYQPCIGSGLQSTKGQCLLISPFAKDKNRKRMGDFADLQLSFVVDKSDPGWLVGLHATLPHKPDGFSLHLNKTQ